MVKMNSSDRRAFKKPSHLTPTDPPVDPILEASSNDPDPQSSRTEGSTLQNSYGKKDTGGEKKSIEAGDSFAETVFLLITLMCLREEHPGVRIGFVFDLLTRRDSTTKNKTTKSAS